MYTPFQLLGKYIRYRIHAKNGRGHGTHSPFVYEFITRVLNDSTVYADYGRVEQLRKELLVERKSVPVVDYGAGSVKKAENKRSVASIAKNAAKPAKYGQLLYRMAKYYHPGTILELGTSLGVTTSYLALGAPAATVTTMEGAPAIAALAGDNFQKLGITNTRQVEGNFDETLAGTIRDLPLIDLIFIDGNHREEPTLRYFHQLLPHTGNDSIIIFDDIHWSAEMERAWKKIKAHPSVRCSIDLFFIGIVFFRSAFHTKQDHTIRF